MTDLVVERINSHRRPLPNVLEFLRENIECLVVAILMALIIRHFIFEPFQIPTGSMATTLMGKHRMIVCEHCEWSWPVSEKASVRSIKCSHCLHVNDQAEQKIWSGEKILANKMVYLLREPKRWETFVFRPPHQKHLNFIKRVIGFGGETVAIKGGDIHIDGSISRKPITVQEKVWIPVYDLEHDIEKTTFFNLGPGWKRDINEEGAINFYAYQDTQDRLSNSMSWSRGVSGGSGDEIIWNDLSYNSTDSYRHLYPVGDLKIECDVVIAQEEGIFSIEIEDGVNRFRLELGRENQLVHFSGLNQIATYPLASKALIGRSMQVVFKNWDDRLVVEIEGQVVLDEALVTAQEEAEGEGTFRLLARDSDIEVQDLKVFRDIYYTAGHSNRGVWKIPANEFFALGDNSNGSNDSRSWGTIPRENLKGRPWLRLLHLDFPFTDTKFDWIEFGQVP